MARDVQDDEHRIEVIASNPVYAVLATPGLEVDLLAPVRAFFEECRAEQRRPIVQTEPGATLSPFVVSWLRALSGFWMTRDAAGVLREVQTGATLTDPIELFEPTHEVDEPHESAFPHTVAMVEAVLEHRAEPSTMLGQAVPIVLTAMGAAPAATWGLHEPLTSPWDVHTLTQHAHTEMPLTGPMYWRSADGYGEIAAARTDDGVVERVQIAVAHRGGPQRALARVRAGIEALATSRMPVMTCAASALGAYEDLRTRAAPAPPERPLAALLGPTVLGRLDRSASEVAREHGGEPVGRARLPGVLVTFDGDLESARRRYLALANG